MVLTSIFNVPEDYEKKFHRVISKSGWIEVPVSDVVRAALPEPWDVLSCLSSGLVRHNIVAGEIDNQGAYACVSFQADGQESYSLLCFRGHATAPEPEFKPVRFGIDLSKLFSRRMCEEERPGAFGITLAYDWYREHKKPWPEVKKKMDQFSLWLDESVSACGFTSIEWEEKSE